jgi:hypothetical protein
MPPARASTLGPPSGQGEQAKFEIFSPAHKRAEGRAPVWGSEFTTKVATLHGDSADISRTLNVKLWNSVTGGVLPPIEPYLLFEPT